MRALHRILGATMAAVLLAGSAGARPRDERSAGTQPQDEIWRSFAEALEPGTELSVRLRNGQRFRATLVAAREDALFLQPKTRVPVAVQPVPYEAILSLERREGGGIGPGKAAAIGVVSGAGAFLAMLLILMAAVD